MPQTDEPPPTYTSVQSSSAPPPPPPAGPSPSPCTPSNVLNFVSISREHASIKEILTVDPSLYIPESFRAPLAKGETESTRKNVRLETVHGQLLAEINLVQDKGALETQSPQRASIHLSSTHGAIKVTIPDNPRRPPFILSAKSQNGDIRLTLPRSFIGPVTVSSREHGHVKASALGAHFVTLSEANGKMKGFIGDLSKYTECDGEGKGWKGDELVLDLKHGSAKLRFDQDATNSSTRATAGEEDSSSSKKSIFAKIFNL